MKTTISPNGTLKVEAETELEAFALEAWWRGYESDTFTISIETQKVTDESQLCKQDQ